MKPIEITEHLNHQDFLEMAFPQVVKPFYKKRLFIINMAFGILFSLASIYLILESLRNHIKFGNMHYFYVFFAFLFIFLAFYLLHREKKYYQHLVDQINNLNTVYTITDKSVNAKNKDVDLTYPISELTDIQDLPKWLIFEFNETERLVIYKPNIQADDLEVMKQKFDLV